MDLPVLPMAAIGVPAFTGSPSFTSTLLHAAYSVVTIPMMMPSITICTFLSLVNGFKLFDQNLSLTAGEPAKMSELLALNIFNTFYGRTGWEGVGQAKAVIFFILVVGIGLLQLRATRSKEVQQ